MRIVNGFANDADRGQKQHNAKRGAEDRVDLKKAGELDHKGRHDNQKAADKGLNDVPERAACVQIIAARFPHQAERDDLCDQSTERHPKHGAGRQMDWTAKPHDAPSRSR